MEFRAAIIGCGGRGREHAQGYAAAPNATIVGCADPMLENARTLGEKYGAPAFSDYHEMLRETRPDVVSVCTWPHLHREMVEAAVAAGVKGIHCEKPMAPTYGDSVAMCRACDAAGVTLTFCHQRRFAPEYRMARDLILQGEIGALLRMEGYCPNLYDWGTHWFDMFHFFHEDKPARWVMGQIDVSLKRSVFGVPVETSGISYIGWEDDVWGLLITGRDPKVPRLAPQFKSEGLTVYGAGGRLDVSHGWVKLYRFGKPEVEPDLIRGPGDTVLSVLNLLECLETGQVPELSGSRALRATELIFATYESSRRRGRVWLPLEQEDSALLYGLEHGFWNPADPS